MADLGHNPRRESTRISDVGRTLTERAARARGGPGSRRAKCVESGGDPGEGARSLIDLRCSRGADAVLGKLDRKAPRAKVAQPSGASAGSLPKCLRVARRDASGTAMRPSVACWASVGTQPSPVICRRVQCLARSFPAGDPDRRILGCRQTDRLPHAGQHKGLRGVALELFHHRIVDCHVTNILQSASGVLA